MKRILFIIILVMSIINSASLVEAHTLLESSIPADGEIVTKEIDEITLHFATKVETLKNVEVLDVNQKSINIEESILNEDEVLLKFATPLENGEYNVSWGIIGIDGHLVNGNVSFSIQIPQELKDNVVNNESTKDELKSTNATEIEDESTELTTVNENELITTDDKQSYPLNWIIMGLLIALGIGIYTAIRKKNA